MSTAPAAVCISTRHQERLSHISRAARRPVLPTEHLYHQHMTPARRFVPYRSEVEYTIELDDNAAQIRGVPVGTPLSVTPERSSWSQTCSEAWANTSRMCANSACVQLVRHRASREATASIAASLISRAGLSMSQPR